MLASVSGALGCEPEDLTAALRAFDTEPPSGEDWLPYLARTVVGSLGADSAAVKFAGTHWFHGTRSLNPERFRLDGLLPLPQVVDSIWDSLYLLLQGEVEPGEWHEFRRCIEAGGGGHFGELYRFKLAFPGDHGPHGELVRDVFINPAARGSHDYLGIPEIVEDISVEAGARFGIDLAARFSTAAQPCLVKFRTTEFQEGALRAALAYGWMVLRDGHLDEGRAANYAHAGNGAAIPPDDIIDVEIVAL